MAKKIYLVQILDNQFPTRSETALYSKLVDAVKKYNSVDINFYDEVILTSFKNDKFKTIFNKTQIPI